ncbi:hypothetical protein [Neobacillus niacini]|uniref:hypothetical protein n=1 Tax=Neobacillus niacini TaxID=86668 RepID=UPI0021CAEF31|nr:hypothetical protein [Neobacillus niacini]MCM3767722.1 hypothetical protein [Neobacillus niacini]
MITEESYTSKASFLDEDLIPTYKSGDEQYVFSGDRIYRGLYRSQNHISINVDVNAEWYENILNFEIISLLEEYFFDRPEIVRSLIEGIYMETLFKVPIRNMFCLLSYIN